MQHALKCNIPRSVNVTEDSADEANAGSENEKTLLPYQTAMAIDRKNSWVKTGSRVVK